MTIIRSPRPDAGWYALDRRIAEDARLSWAARGLLVFLLTKPDHWRVSVSHLAQQTAEARVKTRRDGTYALLAELEAAGYITRRQGRTAAGVMTELEYVVSEVPLPSEPLTAQPVPAQPYTAQTTLDKTKLLDSSRDKTKKASLALCAAQPVDKVKRASRLPDEWTLPDEWRAEGLTIWPGCDIQREADRFRDYWTAQPGQRGVKVNWRSTWRNWIRKAQESVPAARGGARGPEPVRTYLPGSGSTETAVEKAVAYARRMVELGQWTREEGKAHVDEAKRKHGGTNPLGV